MGFWNGNVTLRQLERKDGELLATWLSDPAVLRFYEGRDNPFDLEKVCAVFFENKEQQEMCIVELDGAAIGYLQYYELDEETKELYGLSGSDIYGMDQFIGEPSYWGRGIGTKLIASMISYLREEEGAKSIVMDPRTENLRAIRCYEKCGFKKIKLLPKRELHEGELRDCWLMEHRVL
ncbi:GNAT family N-acetyltransferase [Peribacillus sp. SCS-26]|uniref:GNAT family N-acetyltransferase n=1 Tax=Paraperibacillus marinus TaxID=3115295 RepID=UPI00390614B4